MVAWAVGLLTLIRLLASSSMIRRHGNQLFPALDNIFDNILILVTMFVKPPMRFCNEEDVVRTDALFEHDARDNSAASSRLNSRTVSGGKSLRLCEAGQMVHVYVVCPSRIPARSR